VSGHRLPRDAARAIPGRASAVASFSGARSSQEYPVGTGPAASPPGLRVASPVCPTKLLIRCRASRPLRDAFPLPPPGKTSSAKSRRKRRRLQRQYASTRAALERELYPIARVCRPIVRIQPAMRHGSAGSPPSRKHDR
jgi:hypothetical protein